MAIKFTPNEFLDLASDPSELPSTTDGKDEISGAMRRCKNLHLDSAGVASTRKGSSKINKTAIDELTPSLIVEQNGNRYAFTNTKIYQDEVEIKSDLTEALWTAIKYNSFNSIVENIFALNGYERKRIVEADVYDWGIAAPEESPRISIGVQTGLTGDYNVQHTFCRKEGDVVVCESNPSEEATDAVTLADNSLQIVCNGPDDQQTTHIRTYRTVAGGSTYYHDQDVPIAPYADYAYTHDWEMQDGYLSGDGYQFTTLEEGTAGITLTEAKDLSDSEGVWSKVSGAGVVLDVIGSIGPPGSRTYVRVKIPAGVTGIIKFKKHGGSWDLSEQSYLKWNIYNDTNNAQSVHIYMGEAIYSEQDSDAFSTPVGWYEKAWDITAISNDSIDGITEIGFKHNNTAGVTRKFYFKDITSDTFSGTYQVTYPWEPIDTESYDYAKTMFHWEPIILDTDTEDSALGTEVASDHDQPPLGTFTFGPNLLGVCFILKDNRMYYALPKQPEYWPTNYYLEVSPVQFPLKAGCLYDGTVFLASTIEMYQIQGSGHESWFPSGMSALCGTVSPRVFIPVHGLGIFHLGNDGLYLYAGDKDENITNERFRPIFQGTTVEDVPGINKTYMANCWAIVFKNKLYFGYPTSGEYPDHIFVTDLKTGKTVLYSYGQTFPVVGIDYYNDRLLAVDTSGYVWEIEDPDSIDDDGTAISWSIQSKDYSDQLRKYFPRWARYDLTLGTDATATGTILLNGESKQTHDLTVSRKTKKRLITGCTGDRVAIRMGGTGPVDIFAAEVE